MQMPGLDKTSQNSLFSEFYAAQAENSKAKPKLVCTPGVIYNA